MIVDVFISSEKVTDMVLFRPAVAESAGEDEETEGAVVSVSTMSVITSFYVAAYGRLQRLHIFHR